MSKLFLLISPNLKKCFTILSSSEWYDIIAKRPFDNNNSPILKESFIAAE